MNGKILDSVITAIAQKKQIEPESITSTSSLTELGVTSLDALTIVFDIEEAFDIEVPGDVLESLKTVQDIMDAVSELVAAA